MNAAYAMGRLLWRPALVFVIIPLLIASVLAMWDLPNSIFDIVAAMHSRVATPEVSLALWRFATLLPVMLGLVVSFTIRELQHTTFAWTLPDVSRRLRLGKIASGLMAATVVVVIGAPFTSDVLLFALFGWSVLCFALGGVAFDPALPKLESRSVPALLAALALRPAFLDAIATRYPLVFGVAVLNTAYFVLRREFSPSVLRKRPGIPIASGTALQGAQLRGYWLRAELPEREWSATLADGRLTSWVRAARFEGYGGAKGRIVTVRLISLAFLVTWSYVSASPNFVVFFPWMFLDARSQLLGGFLYPLHRAQRAVVFFASSMTDSRTAAITGFAGLAILFAVGYRFETTGPDSIPGLLFLSLSFATWAPLGHWGNLRGPMGGTMTNKNEGRRFAFIIGYMALAMGPALYFSQLMDPTGAAVWIALGALLLVAHAVYFLALRRHFTRSDMVRPR